MMKMNRNAGFATGRIPVAISRNPAEAGYRTGPSARFSVVPTGSNRVLAGCSIAALAFLATLAFAQAQNVASSRAVFERRILPILKSPNPSSCAECHLSGVDLKDYIRPTEAETFARLRAAGMIDVKRPGDSHLLKLIKMSNPKTPVVKSQTRDVEYNAFRDWIAEASSDPALAKLPSSGLAPIGPKIPNAVIRHERIDTVLASFERNIWRQQGRCMGCHTPGQPDYEKNFAKYGEKIHWFIPDSPEATMRRVIDLKLIDVNQPENSLLLLKPLNKVPHGGGVKFLYGDVGYKQFRSWIEDYAASVTGKYRTAADLPPKQKEALVYTDCILNVTETPPAWGDKLLRVDVYAWDSAKGGWSASPIATGDRGVWAQGRSTNVILFLSVPSGSAQETAARRSPRMPAGRYLLKYYCDTAGKLNQDYRKPTDSPEFYQGQQEITSDWRTGWGDPTKVRVNLQ